jgi:hypothetical protein
LAVKQESDHPPLHNENHTDKPVAEPSGNRPVCCPHNKEKTMKKRLSFFNRLMMAVTFAEANEGDIALQMLDPKASPDPLTQLTAAPARHPTSDSLGSR